VGTGLVSTRNTDIIAGQICTVTYDGTQFILEQSTNKTGAILSGTTGGTFNPTDATTYYFGAFSGLAPTTTASQRRLFVTGITITTAEVYFYNTVLGTAEASSVYIRVNHTTDYLVTNLVDNSATSTGGGTAGNVVTINPGSSFELKWVTPTWVTNPTGVIIYWVLRME